MGTKHLATLVATGQGVMVLHEGRVDFNRV